MESRESTAVAEAEQEAARAGLRTVPEPPQADEIPFGQDAGDRAAKIQEVGKKLATCGDELFDLIHRTIKAVMLREHVAGLPPVEDGELIEQITDLLECTDSDFKVGMLESLRKRQEQGSMTVDDHDEGKSCFDAVVQWLRSQSKETKLAAVLVQRFLCQEHLLPGKDVGNVLYREFEAETLTPTQGSLGFIVGYTSGMKALD